MRSQSLVMQSEMSLSATICTPLLHLTWSESPTLASVTVAPERTSVSTIVTASISSEPSAIATRTSLDNLWSLEAILKELEQRENLLVHLFENRPAARTRDSINKLQTIILCNEGMLDFRSRYLKSQ